MTSNVWSLVEITALALEPAEREAVLGDLAEGGGTAPCQLLSVLGLVIRRQAMLWRNWRPWLAAFGLAMPSSFLLMGYSLAVSSSFRHAVHPRIPLDVLNVGMGLLPVAGHVLLLIAWSYTAGFVVGSVSRQTLWVSIVSCASPCLFCLARFRESSLPAICLLVFLAPAILGVSSGFRMMRMKLYPAVALAAAVSTLTLLLRTGGAWTPVWMLLWPAWYLVATARNTRAIYKPS